MKRGRTALLQLLQLLALHNAVLSVLDETPDISPHEHTSCMGFNSLQRNKRVTHQHTLTRQSCGFLMEI